ncbi:MAG: urease accessory protein UreE [Steroidobacteraceae bacterium]
MDPRTPIDRAILPYESRCKSRLLVTLESGEKGALGVERGRLLRNGDRVRLDADREIEIVAADEVLLEASGHDPLAIAKAAYHLGNRHVAVQVMPDRLRFPEDHVLAQMVAGLGLSVTRIVAPFEPEGGAYGGHHGHGAETPPARPKIHDFSAS